MSVVPLTAPPGQPGLCNKEWNCVLEPLLAEAGRDLGGVGRVELWMSSRGSRSAVDKLWLVAHWADGAYIRDLKALHAEGLVTGFASSVDFFRSSEAEVTMPGKGLAGVLFTEAHWSSSGVRFRRLTDMAADPLLPNDDRTVHAAELFKLAGAVQLPDGRGAMVLYTKHRCDGAETMPACTTAAALPALQSAAHIVSMLASFAVQRKELLNPRRLRAMARWNVVKASVHMRRLIRPPSSDLEASKLPSVFVSYRGTGDSEPDTLGLKLIGEPAKNLKQRVEEKVEAFSQGLMTYTKKCKGANGKAPPMGSWTNFGWTWGGVCLTLLLIGGLNQVIVEASDDLYLLIGSLGALNTLMFAVPNAPLVQPRHVIFGHLISATTAILFNYLSSPEYLGFLPRWVAQALATATSIAAMGKLGVTHPPAGAVCLIFMASPATSRLVQLGWMYILMPVLPSAVITVIMGIAWNNLSAQRQYPIYW